MITFIKKTHVLFLFFTCCTAIGFAMGTVKRGEVTGVVLDEVLKQPMPYVNIIVKDAIGKIITGGITNEDGTFKVSELPQTSTQVDIQFIGYKTVSKKITIGKGNNTINLGTIYLVEDASSLEEVTVVAEVSTIKQKVDRKVITVGKDLTTSGPTASDIFNNIPSVSVDQQTGNISLRGNENVRVMVDGKLSNVPVSQLLKQIPSTAIKNIELITNPSAKYNPEGMSGIINIILHKNIKLGFNGTVDVGLTKEINAKFNSAINLNYRNGKLNFYGSYSTNIGDSDNKGFIDRLSNGILQEFSFGSNNKSHLYKVGADYYINDRNTFSIFTNQNVFDGRDTGETTVSRPDFSTSKQIADSKKDNLSSQYNAVFKHVFKKEGETLDLEVDYNVFNNDETANFDNINNGSIDYTDIVDTKRDRTNINLDYVNPLSETVKLELGAEARLFNSAIDYQSTGESLNATGNTIPTPSTDFSYNRDIYSVYATYSKTLEKWKYQLGVRMEQVKVNANALENASGIITNTPFENEYFQAYPSGFITYTPNETSSYQASFSRRIDRPGVGQVNPIREWSTPLISSFGNPSLEPQFTNSMEVNYTRQLKKGTVTAGVFYRIIEDEINRAVFVDRLDVTKEILTYDNFDNTSAYGIELSSSYRPTKWWRLNGSFDLYSQKQKGITETLNTPNGQAPSINDLEEIEKQVDNVQWNLRVINNFKVNKKLSFSLFGMYRGGSKGIQFNSKPFYFVNTGMRYSFLNNKATFSFNYNDIFDTMRFRFEGEEPFKDVGQFEWESNTWNIALSYRFGGGKYRALNRKRRAKDEKNSGGGFM